MSSSKHLYSEYSSLIAFCLIFVFEIVLHMLIARFADMKPIVEWVLHINQLPASLKINL